MIRDGAPVSVPVIAFNPSGTLIATGDSRGIVRLWDPSTLQQVGPAMGDGSIVYGPVSYTHLDVYKRQDFLHRPKIALDQD